MNTNSEDEQFDVKDLLHVEIKIEPQEYITEIKTETEECVDLPEYDIKYERQQNPDPVASLETISEVEDPQKYLDKSLEDYEKKPEDQQNYTEEYRNNFMSHGCDPSENYKYIFEKEKFETNIYEHSGLQEDTKTADKDNIANKLHSYESTFTAPIIYVDADKTYFTCDICSKSFPNRTDFVQHKIIFHEGDELFTCNFCSKSFAHKSEFFDHMGTHNGEKSFNNHLGMKTFACSFCSKSFIDKTKLNRHINTHTGEKPYTCDCCNNSFSQKCHLAAHTMIHTNERSFTIACDICNKSFTHKYNLKRHMATHTGERPFTCNFCNKSFTQKSKLSVHSLIHTGERPFSCNLCYKAFPQKSHLTAHGLTHSGVKPFSCVICQKSFSKKYTLQKHIMNIHSRK